AHGFVRTKAWQLNSIEQNGDAVSVSMITESDASTRKWWAADFRLLYRVTFGRDLSLKLIATNTGLQTFLFEEALHAYHKVGDATQVRISGLDGVSYLDKTDKFREKVQSGDVIIAAETDRVYLNTQSGITIGDPVLHRKIEIAKEHSRTTVVWNPWTEKAHELADLGEDQWKYMLCVETSNVGDFAVQLAPSQQHTLQA